MALWFHDLNTNDCWHWKNQHVEITITPSLTKRHEDFAEFRIFIKFIDFHAQKEGMYVTKDSDYAKIMAMQMAHDALMGLRDKAYESDLELFEDLKEMKSCE